MTTDQKKAELIIKLNTNKENFTAYTNDMLRSLREDEFYGRLGIEQRVHANFSYMLRSTGSMIAIMDAVAEYLKDDTDEK